MSKDKPNQGWTKELKKTPKPEAKKPFDYKRPISKVDKPLNMAVNARSRSYKSAPIDKSTSLKTELKKKD